MIVGILWRAGGESPGTTAARAGRPTVRTSVVRTSVAAAALLVAVQWHGVPVVDRPALFVRPAVTDDWLRLEPGRRADG